MRLLVTAIVIFLLAAVPAMAGTLYFAQVADGGGCVTTITIMNPKSSLVTGTLSFKGDDGRPWSITLADGSSGSDLPVTVPAWGSKRIVSAGAGQTKTGWAVLTSDSTLFAVETFDYRVGSTLVYSVGVVGNEAGRRFSFPVDTSSKTDDGVAIANVGDTPLYITVRLTDENGNTVATVSSDSRLQPLGTLRHVSLYASELFPSLKSGSFKGSMVVEAISYGDIAVVGLSFKEAQVSAIPVFILPYSTQEMAQQLLGDWTFEFTVGGVPTTKQYVMDAVAYDANAPGQWYAKGTDASGGLVVAYWFDDVEQYQLADPDPPSVNIFNFAFSGKNAVRGEYYTYYSNGSQSATSAMSGGRVQVD
jgi:hypothetical protein